jgi:hypothetical protein
MALLGATLISPAARADIVVLTPSSSAVAVGGSLSFTVTVVPGTYVQSVALGYQGEAGQDQLSSPPFIFSHQFTTPRLNSSVTATVTYSNGAPADITGITINIIGLTLTGNASPTRGSMMMYTARSNPPGVPMIGCTWTYTWPGGSYQHIDLDAGDDKSIWSGIMVVDGTLTCTSTVGGVLPGATLPITITPRTWVTPVTCAQDNDATWGDPPTPQAELGLNRDRDSDVSSYIFVPRGPTNFYPAFTVAKVSLGPCKDWWYISSTTLKSQRETVINKYIKPGGPALGGLTFSQVNESCFDTSAFLQAVKNHEYRGTPDTPYSWEGHQGRIEYQVLADPLYPADPRKHIEPLTSRSQTDLKSAANLLIVLDEFAVANYALSEGEFTNFGPNWGIGYPDALGAGRNSRWLETNWSGDCNYLPDNF